MAVINTREYIDGILAAAENGEEVFLPVAGSSMSPFLVDKRDAVCLVKPGRDPEPGDILLYRRENGQYVLHRAHHIENGSCYMLGDAQTDIEGPVPFSSVCGLVTKARHKGKWIRPGDTLWNLFAGPWRRMVSLRQTALSVYTLFKK